MMKVAAIQLNNYLGEMVQSFIAAENLIIKAVEEKAEMVFLPELSTCGYIPNDDIWSFGEKSNGITNKWLSEMSKKYSIYIGAGFLECDGHDFYNSYAISSPEGKILGVIRKVEPEASCFKGSDVGSIINTPVGKIAVGICADSHKKWFFQRMKKERPDLLILPHAWATPSTKTGIVKDKDIEDSKKIVHDFGAIYARQLNIPVIFINSWGIMPKMMGILGKTMFTNRYLIQGASAIFDSHNLAVYCKDEENYLVADISFQDKKDEDNIKQRFYWGWIHPGSWFIRKIIIPLDIAKGKKHYLKSKVRKEKADAVFDL
ncbi:MAG: carbon-nitrogen hydrolase family protein [Bacilli bacterium]|nr:carbon-nitrogen hydrolase family protein [Bacilli bacterium]